MEFNDYQKKAHTTALYLNKINEVEPNLSDNMKILLSLSYAGLGLGETGETQNKVKKILRDSGGIITTDMKNDIKKELGDILWYVAEMCTVLNLDMSEVAETNIEKLFSRKDRGVIMGNGDNR